MAFMHVDFMSGTLRRSVQFNAVFPVDNYIRRKASYDGKPLKTLYLLHGLLGDYNDWPLQTNIQALATRKNLAVIMPSGDNSFFVDAPIPNFDYGRFIGEELVDVTRQMFNLSRKREDTFIAGFSMGGFGALRNGFIYSETFGYIGALSNALNIFELPASDPRRCLFHEDAVFGDLEKARTTDKNPRVALTELVTRAVGDKFKYPPCVHGMRAPRPAFGRQSVFQGCHRKSRTRPDLRRDSGRTRLGFLANSDRQALGLAAPRGFCRGSQQRSCPPWGLR